MSGLIVRPGDTLWLPLLPSQLTEQKRAALKAAVEAEFPGVTVVIVEGFAGGPFVYRPNTESSARAAPPVG